MTAIKFKQEKVSERERLLFIKKERKRELIIVKVKRDRERVILITSSSLNLPALQIRSKSSPPAAYSITIAKCVGVKTTCKL